ncbi:hypothetical protein ACWDTB_12275, partial [Streptomyces sp. NPDC003487]
MTQSGQGEEPSAQPAREGIVLPSDGGDPVLPGGPAQGPYTGGPYGGGPQPGAHHGQQPGTPQYGTPGAAAPAEGQAWGGAWGPGPPLVRARRAPSVTVH